MSAFEEVLKDLQRYNMVNLSNYTPEQAREVKDVIERLLNHRYTPETHPVIAIDMDGTIWTDTYPEHGVVFPHAIEVINEMVEVGYDVIIWTSRGGVDMDACRDVLTSKGLNKNLVWNDHSTYYTSKYPIQSPKIGAGVYIDDKAYGAPDFSNYWLTLRKKFIPNT